MDMDFYKFFSKESVFIREIRVLFPKIWLSKKCQSLVMDKDESFLGQNRRVSEEGASQNLGEFL
jgi:hypothetical protein